MIRNLLSLTAVFLCSLVGCGEPTQPASRAFEIHVQSSFEQTWVHFEMDGQTVFAGNQSTDPLIGLATVVHTEASPGLHRVRVVAGTSEQRVDFELGSDAYVLVRRSLPDGAIEVVVTNERPVYE